MLQGLIERLKVLLTHHRPVTNERRKLIRLRCRVVLDCQSDNPQGQVLICDLSLAGMRLESKDPFKKGESLRLALPGSDRSPVQCKVIWTKKIGRAENFSAGVVYDESEDNLARSWIKEVLRQVGFGEGRIKERRAHVRIPSRLRCALANKAGDVLADGQLLNIGLGGALVSVPVEVTAGTRVRFMVDPVAGYPALDLMSTIRSCRKDVQNQRFLHGLKFDNQEDPLVVRYLGVLLKLG